MADRQSTELVRTCERVSFLEVATRKVAQAAGELQGFIAVSAKRDLGLLEKLKAADPNNAAAVALFDQLAQDYAVTAAQLYQQASKQLLREQGRFEQEALSSEPELGVPVYTVLNGSLESGR